MDLSCVIKACVLWWWLTNCVSACHSCLILSTIYDIWWKGHEWLALIYIFKRFYSVRWRKWKVQMGDKEQWKRFGWCNGYFILNTVVTGYEQNWTNEQIWAACHLETADENTFYEVLPSSTGTKWWLLLEKLIVCFQIEILFCLVKMCNW